MGFARIIDRRMTSVDGSKQLGITARQMGRLVKAFKSDGPESLISKKRGKRSNRAYPKELKQQVLQIVTDRYADFGPTLIAEKLQAKHDIVVSDETIRRWLTEAGLRESRSQKLSRAYQPRHRRECFGELIQIDGSDHHWFEGRGPRCTLLEIEYAPPVFPTLETRYSVL